MINLQNLALVPLPIIDSTKVQDALEQVRVNGDYINKSNMKGVAVYGDVVCPLPIPLSSSAILESAPLLIITYRGKEFVSPLLTFSYGDKVEEDFTETKEARFLIQDATFGEELITLEDNYNNIIENFKKFNLLVNEIKPGENGLTSTRLDTCLYYCVAKHDEIWELSTEVLDTIYPTFPTEALERLSKQLRDLLIPRLYIGTYDKAMLKARESIKLALFITALQTFAIVSNDPRRTAIIVNNTELHIKQPIDISHLLDLIKRDERSKIEKDVTNACFHPLCLPISESEVFWSQASITPSFLGLHSSSQESIVSSMTLGDTNIILEGINNNSIQATVISNCGTIFNETGYLEKVTNI